MSKDHIRAPKKGLLLNHSLTVKVDVPQAGDSGCLGVAIRLRRTPQLRGSVACLQTVLGSISWQHGGVISPLALWHAVSGRFTKRC